MIRTEQEYREAAQRLKVEKTALDKHREELIRQEFSEMEVKNLMDPLLTFHAQLSDEIEEYVRTKQKHISELTNLRGIGHMLICARIASGFSQVQLAAKMGVDPSQVSRDERNEYRGITIDRAAKILEALGVRVSVKCQVPDPEAECALA